MKHYYIYTAGKMSGLSIQDQVGWRYEADRLFHEACCENYDIRFTCINPPEFYSYRHPFHKTEIEVKMFDLANIKRSDIVLVNLDGIESSIGTIYELATIDEYNRSGHKHIYVVAFGTMPKNLHPWITSSIFRHEENLSDAVTYIVDYLML